MKKKLRLEFLPIQFEQEKRFTCATFGYPAIIKFFELVKIVGTVIFSHHFRVTENNGAN